MAKIVKEHGEEIVVADEPVLLVDKVEPLEEYKLKLKFNDGSKKIFNFESRLNKGVFRRLQNKTFFEKAHVDDGVVVWDDTLDIATETLYAEGAAA